MIKQGLKKLFIGAVTLFTAVSMCLIVGAAPAATVSVDMEKDTYEVPGFNGGGFTTNEGCVSFTTDEKHSGNRSLKVDMSKIDWGAIYNVTLEPGTYEVSAWVKTQAFLNGQGFSLFAAKASDNTHLASSLAIETGSADWTKYALEFTVPEKMDVLMGFQPFVAGKCRGTIYIDDVFFGEKGAEPAAQAPNEEKNTPEDKTTTEDKNATEAESQSNKDDQTSKPSNPTTGDAGVAMAMVTAGTAGAAVLKLYRRKK